jgi:hypothetical protein
LVLNNRVQVIAVRKDMKAYDLANNIAKGIRLPIEVLEI